MQQQKKIQLTAGQTWDCTVENAADGDQVVMFAHLAAPANDAGWPHAIIMRGRLDGTRWMVSDGGGWLHDEYPTFAEALEAITDPGRRQLLRDRTTIAHEAFELRRKARELNDAASLLLSELEAGEPNIHIRQEATSRARKRRVSRS
jgi:hypothetical protein